MIVVVDYKLGNLFSVAKALEYVGAPVRVSADPADLRAATHIVLPGVGAFPQGMHNLERTGLLEILREEVLGKKKPFLGICLGMQLLADKGYEHEECAGLGWIGGEVRKLETGGLKVPHVGWNDVTAKEGSKLFEGIKQGSDFYFVHSYTLACIDASAVAATADYGGAVTAAVEQGNIHAVQFHPEKSQEAGLKLLENFLRYA